MKDLKRFVKEERENDDSEEMGILFKKVDIE